MKHCVLVLNGLVRFTMSITQAMEPGLALSHTPLEGNIMIAFVTILATIGVAGIAGSISLVARDGYGQVPNRPLVRMH